MKIILAILFSIITLFGKSVTVAAAANLKSALEEITANFTKESGIEIKIITGSSGKLSAQIINGAPFDIFMSADVEYPTKLYKANYTVNEPKIYAYGSLVLIGAKGFDMKGGINALLSPNISKIAIANPKTAPYGIEAINTMKSYGIYERVKDKLVIAENIAQVANFVDSGTVSVGFCAKSLIVAPTNKNKNWIDIDQQTYTPIDQAAVILKNSKNKDGAKKFFDYIYTKKSVEVFKKYGYNLPNYK